MDAEPAIGALPVTAAEAREHLTELESERALARATGVSEIATYMSDIEAELRIWRRVYVISAVTEIATLRGELFGIQVG
jgi:hypothetical protein